MQNLEVCRGLLRKEDGGFAIRGSNYFRHYNNLLKAAGLNYHLLLAGSVFGGWKHHF